MTKLTYILTILHSQKISYSLCLYFFTFEIAKHKLIVNKLYFSMPQVPYRKSLLKSMILSL